MNIFDLLNKFVSNDDIEYLKNEFGSIQYINDLFTSTMGIKYIIENRNLDYRFYEIFHIVYEKIENDKTIDNTILNCLIIIESYYTVYSKSKKELDKIKNTSNRYNEKDVELKLNNDILNMYNIDTLPKNYKYYDLANRINQEKSIFSINQMFSENIVFDKKEGFNAVSIITPHQTISRYNAAKFNNMVGSGYHDVNFEEILKVVYGNKFENNVTGQDIKIRYTTMEKFDGSLLFSVLLEIPLVINSSQVKSLQYLNEEIKRVANNSNHEIVVFPSVFDYNSRNSVISHDIQTNLDCIFNDIIIDDSSKEKYPELCFAGYSNLENHYNVAQYTR